MNKKAGLTLVIVCSAVGGLAGGADADIFYTRMTGTISGGTLGGVSFGESYFEIHTAFDSDNVSDISATRRGAANDWAKVYIENIGVVTLVDAGQTHRINNGADSFFSFIGAPGATMYEFRDADFLDFEPATIMPETTYTRGGTGPWNIFPQFTDQGALVLTPDQYPITGTLTISDAAFAIPSPTGALLFAAGGIAAARRRRG